MNNTYTWRRVSYSQVLSPNPVYLASVVVTPKDGENCDVVLYDGESTKDPQIIELRNQSKSTHIFNFSSPIKTQRGLYIVLDSDTDEALVQFYWTRE